MIYKSIAQSAYVIATCLLTLSFSTISYAQKSSFPSSPEATGSAEGLTRETSDPGQEDYPKVSPDGKWLLYNSLETTSYLVLQPSWKLDVKTNRKLQIVKKQIGVPTTNPLVTHAAYPTWLPDGSGIIYSYVAPEKPVIVRSNTNGVGLNYISQAALGDDDAEPIITKDGKTIIFTTIHSGERKICSMDIKGGNFSIIGTGSHIAFNPKNPDQIIYNAMSGKFIQIFTMNLKTGERSQLTTGDYNNRDGAFSQDGKYIAFVSNRDAPKKPNHHLYIMNVDGSNMVQLSRGDTNEANPCFGPDGTIFFSSNADKNYNIWKVKPKF
ncbi:DUF5050 domain-containing protein [Rudanella paleaurantiibacter]|uniref:DUF5050 domain-containing protein n=1 Tax=Rudanella paleaurantiibacter TaxID=2614655 RepID=A0A7J5U115_9BACT|nr:DUF5050 domain-containing protein [Rudanella paleaurantiibacter]KAB7731453.1 DUF5050 domain-containing protein [Rudanella paleaurantiibacter]